MKKPQLSIIILNHNTKDLLRDCLMSLSKVRDEVNSEVIVSDNSSTDGSMEMVRKEFKWVNLIEGPNVSYSNGNNRARHVVLGEYVLFLNSDTLVHNNALLRSVKYLRNNSQVGALTCKLVLPNGQLDKDVRRRFTTPWISFKRLFLRSTTEYWYENVNEDQIHEVDAIQGAFFLTTKEILDKVGWFDENYYFDGEDLDLCFQIKKLGYKIIYYPVVSVTHIKKATRRIVDKETNIKRKMQGVDSMEYFYRKNLWNSYPRLVSYLVLSGIKLLKVIRFIQVKIS